MNKFVAGLGFVLAAMWPLAPAQAQEPLPVGVHHQILWVPDFYGSKVYRYEDDYTVSPPKFSAKTIQLTPTENCNPNSVAIKGNKLYVVCNSSFGGLDQILVLNATTFAYVKTIDGTGPASASGGSFAYFAGASLIGVSFDIHGNLWVGGYASNSLYRIPAANLATASPQVDRQVIDSPDAPAGMVFTPSGALWVVGQYLGGILVQFPDAVINVAGTYLHDSPPLNATPSQCLSNVATDCNRTPGLFNNPEGVAVFDGAVWVANNGGGAPGLTLVRAVPNKPAAGQFRTSTYGGVANKPFSCPGGLFAPTLAGATPELWVNDEGFNFPNGGTCGGTSATQGSGVGRVNVFTAGDLINHRAAPTPESFPGAGKLKTGSPGFGGIFVQLD